MNPSVIQVNNVALRTFEEAGVHTHAAGIASYYRLGYQNVLPVGSQIFFKLPVPVLLKTLWLSGLEPFSEGYSIYLTVGSVARNFSNTFEIKTESIAVNTGEAVWEIPFLILEPDFELYIQANFEIARFSFFAQPCNVYPFVLGQLQ
jgi:hypothetical protein